MRFVMVSIPWQNAILFWYLNLISVKDFPFLSVTSGQIALIDTLVVVV